METLVIKKTTVAVHIKMGAFGDNVRNSLHI
ncbi:Uncharacterised protein [Vibrio cholerae]|nr:Uncharacterised protein [Vibrio cholerae]